MLNKEFQDGILVRLLNTDKNDEFIRGYWTHDFSETLKMYQFVFEKNIDICILAEDNDDDNDKYNDAFATIIDIEVCFGGETRLTCINIYVAVREYK